MKQLPFQYLTPPFPSFASVSPKANRRYALREEKRRLWMRGADCFREGSGPLGALILSFSTAQGL